LFKGDVIKGLKHLLFHCLKSSCMAGNIVVKLYYTLILLNEI
jgi:hypothetical protein